MPQWGVNFEVIWGFWLLKELKVGVSRQATDLILANSGPLVLCLLPHFSRKGLTADKRLKRKLGPDD